MADEHYCRASPIECWLISTAMEIDDDDQDVIQVSIEVCNEAAIPFGGLDIFIQTSDKRRIDANEGISSLGPGLTRMFTFEFPLTTGEWTFMLRSPSVSADLGPYSYDFTFATKKSRVYNNNIGSGLFNDAFSTDLGNFGQIEERGVIDASEIVMTSYVGENSRGGATAISVDNKLASDKGGEKAKIPPWEKNSNQLSDVIDHTTQSMISKTDEDLKTESLTDFTAASQSSTGKIIEDVNPAKPVDNDDAVTANSSPPSKPLTAPPSKPPTAPPSKPPMTPPLNESPSETGAEPATAPPSKPPTAPPSKPPKGPPSKPPTTPPSKPPTTPPSKPPTAPPSKPPKGPPSKPPTTPPTKPPKGPPSKPPNAPRGPASRPPKGPPNMSADSKKSSM